MKIVDMHCDAIYCLLESELKGNQSSLYANNLSVDIQKLNKGNYLLQNFKILSFHFTKPK